MTISFEKYILSVLWGLFEWKTFASPNALLNHRLSFHGTRMNILEIFFKRQKSLIFLLGRWYFLYNSFETLIYLFNIKVFLKSYTLCIFFLSNQQVNSIRQVKMSKCNCLKWSIHCTGWKILGLIDILLQRILESHLKYIVLNWYG